MSGFHHFLTRLALFGWRHLRSLMKGSFRMSHASRLGSLVVVLALLSSGTAAAEPRKPTHVACVGDSITAGSGSSAPAKSYPSQLQGLLGDQVKVQNFGRSGATMLSAGYGDLPYDDQVEFSKATTFVSDAGAGAIVSVIVILGANDSKPQNWEPADKPKNDQQYLSDYRALVDHFLGLPTKPVVYVGLPLATGTNPCCAIRGNVIHDEQIPLIKQVAMEKHLPVIDLNTPTTGHPEYFGDGVHPNDAGYAVMANLVKQGLAREPLVSVTSPSSGAMPAAGKLSLSAMASGDTVPIASVEFFDGAGSLGKVMAEPFVLDWQATTGAHTITAKATDATLANKTSEVVAVTVKDAVAGGVGGGAGAASAGASGGGVASAGAAGAGGSLGGTASGAGGSVPAGVAGATTQHETPAADGGCSCATPRPGVAPNAAWLLLLLSALAVRRRG